MSTIFDQYNNNRVVRWGNISHQAKAPEGSEDPKDKDQKKSEKEEEGENQKEKEEQPQLPKEPPPSQENNPPNQPNQSNKAPLVRRISKKIFIWRKEEGGDKSKKMEKNEGFDIEEVKLDQEPQKSKKSEKRVRSLSPREAWTKKMEEHEKQNSDEISPRKMDKELLEKTLREKNREVSSCVLGADLG